MKEGSSEGSMSQGQRPKGTSPHLMSKIGLGSLE
jgi:hypothetical protein